jgi:hypothetical protein
MWGCELELNTLNIVNTIFWVGNLAVILSKILF